MEVASFVIACIALVLSVAGFGWQVFTWQRDRRYDVHVKLRAEPIEVGDNKVGSPWSWRTKARPARR